MKRELYSIVLQVFNEQAIDLITFKGKDGVPLSNVHCRVLSYIHAKPRINMVELTDKIKVHKSTITRIVSQLEEWGYVVRHPNETDQRRFDLMLTEHGDKEYLEIGKNFYEKYCERMFRGFDETEIKIAREIFSKMLNNALN